MEFSFITQYFFAILIILVTILYGISYRQNYFKRHNIPYIKSTPFLGAFWDVIQKKMGFYDKVLDLCDRPEVKDKPFFGMFVFHKPAIMINDPELIKRVLVKDFNDFAEHYSSSDNHDPLGYYNLFGAKHDLWKKIRTRLSPFFSSGKLKMMYYKLDKISDDLNQYIHRKLGSSDKVELEIKEISALFTTDVIASCAYGVEANSLENPEGEFRCAGRAHLKYALKRQLELTAYFMLPQIMKLFNFSFFAKETQKFIKSTIPHVIKERMKSGNKRHDLIDTLIELKSKDETLTDEILMAQAAVFFAAGRKLLFGSCSFDTKSIHSSIIRMIIFQLN